MVLAWGTYFAGIIVAVTCAVWGSFKKEDKKIAFPLEDSKENAEGAKPKRNHVCFKALVTTSHPDVKTVYDVYMRAVKEHKHRRAVGYRKELKVFKEEKEIVKVVGGVEKKEKKTWIFKKFSPYYWLSYEEFGKIAHAIGSGLKQLGCTPGSKLTLFAPTRLGLCPSTFSFLTYFM
jgi:long-chain acyl-CoA synthetase